MRSERDMAWKPGNSTPKEGRVILFVVGYKVPFFGWYSARDNVYEIITPVGLEVVPIDEVSHWMPSPEAPNLEQS